MGEKRLGLAAEPMMTVQAQTTGMSLLDSMLLSVFQVVEGVCSEVGTEKRLFGRETGRLLPS